MTDLRRPSARNGHCECCNEPTVRRLCPGCATAISRIRHMDPDAREELRDRLHVTLARWEYAVLKTPFG